MNRNLVIAAAVVVVPMYLFFVQSAVYGADQADTAPAQQAQVDDGQAAGGGAVPSCCAISEVGEVDPMAIKPTALSIGENPSKPSLSDGGVDDGGGQPSVARVSEWTEPADRVGFDLDFEMTNQAGTAVSLKEWLGSPVAVSFIYTRCPDPNMCPLITARMANLQRDLATAGLTDRVKLALISYDPVFDTPQRLKQYGEDRGVKFSANAVALQPNPDRFRELLHEFQIGVNYQADGSIGHFIELLVIDHQGRFVRDYQGRVWDNAAVLADLQKLVEEQVVAAAQ